METKTLRMTHDPLFLVKFALQRYTEELEGKDTKAVQYARYEYLHSLENDELEQLLMKYVEAENIQAITLEDWRKDAKCIFKFIYESERYRAIFLKMQKRGYGSMGKGVFDKTDMNTH